MESMLLSNFFSSIHFGNYEVFFRSNYSNLTSYTFLFGFALFFTLFYALNPEIRNKKEYIFALVSVSIIFLFTLYSSEKTELSENIAKTKMLKILESNQEIKLIFDNYPDYKIADSNILSASEVFIAFLPFEEKMKYEKVYNSIINAYSYGSEAILKDNKQVLDYQEELSKVNFANLEIKIKNGLNGNIHNFFEYTVPSIKVTQEDVEKAFSQAIISCNDIEIIYKESKKQSDFSVFYKKFADDYSKKYCILMYNKYR